MLKEQNEIEIYVSKRFKKTLRKRPEAQLKIIELAGSTMRKP